MGKIRSALEIALERTESVQSDKKSITVFETKQKGKRLANSYLDGEIKSLEDEIKKTPKEEQASLKQGIIDVLASQLRLPEHEDDLVRVENAAKGISAASGESRFSSMAKQLSQVLRQFLSEAAQYDEAIKRQYAPKLKQKEEELSRRMGRQVKLDPFQDPEFTAFYNQHLNALKDNYQTILDEMRAEANNSFPKN